VFERFTDDARRTTVLAQEEARLLGHNHIGTEHLLLGALHTGGTAAQALATLGLTLERTRDEVVARTEVGRDLRRSNHIPFTTGAKKAMEMGLREALALDDSTITTAHLVLGVLAVEDDVGLQVVTAVTSDVEEIRSWLRQNRTVEDSAPPIEPPLEEERRSFRIVSGGARPRSFGSDGDRCAFCDRDLWEVERSIAGIDAVICSDCVDAATERLRTARDGDEPTAEPLHLPPRVLGPAPTDPGAVADVETALRAAVGGGPRTDEVMAAAMEDGEELAPLVRQAGQRYPGTGLRLVAMRFLHDDHAQVRFEILVKGIGGVLPVHGDLVRRSGRWMVTRETILRVLGRGDGQRPPTPQ
jgi:ATP-dependent Clp protease ATP-binding subunit ClpC